MATFINYSTGQENYVTHFQQTLNRIVGANPYVSERIGSAGTRIDEKLKRMLDVSRVMVSIQTYSTVSDGTWQNQEIGYFTAQGKPIIPMKEEGLQVKGFLEGTEYITLKPNDLDTNSYELIAIIRQRLRLGRFRVECSKCGAVFEANIPSHNDINIAIDRNAIFPYDCFKCGSQIEVTPKSLACTTVPQYSYTPNYR